MKINGYVLAADPEWVIPSVLSYYQIVEKIVVSYDQRGLGWTGEPIDVDRCLGLLRSIDHENKMVFLPGDHSSCKLKPGDADTFQRREAFMVASMGADWVLQVDTDELVSDPYLLLERLRVVPLEFDGLEIPAQSFFGHKGNSSLIQICDKARRRPSFELCPIAIRSSGVHKLMRHSVAPYRVASRISLVRGFMRLMRRIMMKKAAPSFQAVAPDESVLHMSWVRSKEGIIKKTKSWGHAEDFNTEAYVNEVWSKAPENWADLTDVHPIWGGLWPALRLVNINDLGLNQELLPLVKKELEMLSSM